MIYRALRPLLFRLDPERAHRLSLNLMRVAGAVPPLRVTIRAALGARHARPVRVLGLDFPNPLGLAAGYDKDGTAWRGLTALGFGHLEIGTVTLDRAPQPI